MWKIRKIGPSFIIMVTAFFLPTVKIIERIIQNLSE